VIEQLGQARDRALSEIAAAQDEETLERLRVAHLGRKAPVNELLSGMASVPPEQRRAVGQAGNEAKQAIQAALDARSSALKSARLADLAETDAIDVTFPAPPLERGHIHVLTQVRRELETVMERIGYHVEEGPEVETDWYNFQALNIDRDHPARDSQDSMYFSPDLLLRTQTSPVQIRAMERLGQPPIYVVTPGRVYRRDAVDASHFPAFTQLEGLAVDEGLTVADMLGTLHYMVQSVLGEDRRVRVRPSYFPFTEPSFEFDVSCAICEGKGCSTCGWDGWLELGGCGMVHPQVLRNGAIDPERYSGYAWGFGVERIAMMRHDIRDIRLFFEGDLRFLEQF
jgi:phenylalanyl-tRNA synthetase alpha chain